MADEGEEDLDQLVGDLLERALQHVMAVPANGWEELLREWDDFTSLEIIDVIDRLDEPELRAFAEHLLHRLTVLHRTEILEDTFPALRYSKT